MQHALEKHHSSSRSEKPILTSSLNSVTNIPRISMTEHLSGVVQVPRRCPVRSGTESLILPCTGCVIRKLSACPPGSYRENNSTGRLPLFNFGIQTDDGGVAKDKVLSGQVKNRTGDLESKAPVHLPLSYHFTPPILEGQ